MTDLNVADFPTTDPDFDPEINLPRTDVLYAYTQRVDLRKDGSCFPAPHLHYLTVRVRLEKACQNLWAAGRTGDVLCRNVARYVATFTSDQYGQHKLHVCSDCADDVAHDARAGFLGEDTVVLRHSASGHSLDF